MRYAVILAGGSGQRLWPASRRARPKQFLPLGARPQESLLAGTRRRLSALCPAEQVVVVTAAEQVPMVREALPDLPAHNLLAEPAARNTAAALGLAATHLVRRDPEALLGALPADHYIADEIAFAGVVERAFDLAGRRDVIVTIGVVPTRAETGFGYLEVGPPLDDDAGELAARRVDHFVEKPDPDTARRYLAGGEHLWNAGMFFVSARRLLRELDAHMPETAAGLRAIGQALDRGDAASAAETTRRVYAELAPISIDHGVMERAADVVTLPGDFGWNDVGSWAALADYRPAGAGGNITQGTVVCHDARDNIAIGDPDRVIALVGVEGLVVVQSGDAILVVPRERAQDVRAAARLLDERGLSKHL